MTAATLVYRHTLRQLLSVRRALALGILAALPGLILAIAATTVTAQRLEELFHSLTANLLLSIALPVTTVVLAAASLGEERRGGTLPYLLLKPVPRIALVSGKTIAAFTASAAIGAVGVLLAWLVVGAVAGGWALWSGPLLAVVLATVGYTAVFVPFGYVTNRATLAGLAYVFIWERALSDAVDALAPSSIWRTGLTGYLDVLSAPDLDDLLGTLTVGTWGAVTKMAVLALVGIAVTTVLVRYGDNA